MPSQPATLAAHGPAASTNASPAMREPSARRSATTRSRSTSKPVASAAT
jgi:hypothetical protein